MGPAVFRAFTVVHTAHATLEDGRTITAIAAVPFSLSSAASAQDGKARDTDGQRRAQGLTEGVSPRGVPEGLAERAAQLVQFEKLRRSLFLGLRKSSRKHGRKNVVEQEANAPGTEALFQSGLK